MRCQIHVVKTSRSGWLAAKFRFGFADVRNNSEPQLFFLYAFTETHGSSNPAVPAKRIAQTRRPIRSSPDLGEKGRASHVQGTGRPVRHHPAGSTVGVGLHPGQTEAGSGEVLRSVIGPQLVRSRPAAKVVGRKGTQRLCGRSRPAAVVAWRRRVKPARTGNGNQMLGKHPSGFSFNLAQGLLATAPGRRTCCTGETPQHSTER